MHTRMLMHVHTLFKGGKNQFQSNFQITNFTRVFKVFYSWSSAILLFAKQNQDQNFLVLFLKESVQNYGRHLQLLTQEPSTNMDGITWSQSKPSLSPKVASQFPLALHQGPCANPAGSVCVSSGSQGTSKTHHRPANNSFFCKESNPRVREWKLKKKNHFALMQSSIFPCFLGKR